MKSVDVERLIPDDHPARAIWEFVSRLDLSSYEDKVKSLEGSAGRPAYEPRLLVSIWVYAYSDGEGSAREIERLCSYDPAYQWLTGMEEISHHTLSNFRIAHKKELDELFTQVIGLLSAEKLITMKRTTLDGTKIKACASAKSFRREATVQDHLEKAREQIKAMGDPRGEIDGKKRAKARLRASRERSERLEKALTELPKIRALKSDEEGRREARVSETDPEARKMKQGNGGYAPSYNVQLTVDAENSMIVNADVSQAPVDSSELEGAVENVEKRTGQKPVQMIADAGYTNRANIVAMDKQGIDFIGSLPDRSGTAKANRKRRRVSDDFCREAFHYDEESDVFLCPAGEELRCAKTDQRRDGVVQYTYRAKAAICAACKHQAECVPLMKTTGRELTRDVEEPAVTAFREKMKTDDAKETYKIRAGCAEFPNAWIKDKIGLRQFRTRGKMNATQETLWACIAYNIQQWIRLSWKPDLAADTG